MALQIITAKREDSPHVSGDAGQFVLAVRNDARTPLAGTTLDYIPLTTNSVGDLHVDASGVTIPVVVMAGDIDISSHYVDNFQILTSSVYSTSPTAYEASNFWAKGMYVTVSCTVRSGDETMTPALAIKDDQGANIYTTVWTAATPISAVGVSTYLFYPATVASATAGWVTPTNIVERVDLPLPRVWRLSMTHAGTGSMTYSVGGMYCW